MNNLPKVNQLRNFRAIIHSGSIRAAALATHQTQSGVSRSIQELENIVGAQLLKRGVGGVQLTSMGEIFEPYVNRVLTELERGLEDVYQFINSSKCSLWLGCSHLPAYTFMPKVINKFQDKFTSVRLTLIEGQLPELIQSIRTGKINLFVGITMPGLCLDEFDVEYFSTARFYIFCSKYHPMVNATSLKEVKNEKWCLTGTSQYIPSSLEKEIFPYGKGDGGAILHGDSMAIAERLILKENYISIGPKEILESNYLKGKVSIIPVKEKLPTGRYVIVQRKQIKQPPLIKHLVGEIRHQLTLSDTMYANAPCFSEDLISTL